MKRTLMITLLLLSPAAMLAQTQHLFFNQSGAFASISQQTSTNTSYNLYVANVCNVSGKTCTPSTTTANINYSSFNIAPDFSSVTTVQISGAIPISTFTGTTTSNLALNLSTSQLDPTTSVNQSCTIDLINFTETCGAGPSGTFSLKFAANNVTRTHLWGSLTQSIVGNVTTWVAQTSDNGSANVSGSILGTSVTSSFGQVGTNNSASLEIVKQ